MTRSTLLRSWLVEPPIPGKWAPLWILLSLPVAAFIRSMMNCPDAIGECCTPLVIFVMLTAILLGSFWAAAVAVMTAVVSLFLFEKHGAPVMTHESGEVWGLTVYSLYCAAAIAAVEFTRRTLARYSRIGAPREKSSGIIFSEEDGQAWASWPGNPSPVRLGPQLEVAAMMQDFILQTELAHRLARNSKTASEETSLYAEPQDLR